MYSADNIFTFFIYFLIYEKCVILFTDNASRYCRPGGVWDDQSDYMHCQPLETNNPMYPDPSVLYTSYFYYGGYTISLVALVAAVSIFVYFK